MNISKYCLNLTLTIARANNKVICKAGKFRYIQNDSFDNPKNDKSELSGLELATTCGVAAEEKKAQNVVILNVSKLTSFADYFVICSGNSERQVQAIFRNIHSTLKDLGISPSGIEGTKEGQWVLGDYGDVVVHVFLDSARFYYDLEGFWSDAERIRLH